MGAQDYLVTAVHGGRSRAGFLMDWGAFTVDYLTPELAGHCAADSRA